MPGKPYSSHFLPLSEKEKEISSSLHDHVYKLAGDIGERNIWLPSKLNAAAAYIESSWINQDYTVRHQEYDARGVKSTNLEIDANSHSAGTACLPVAGIDRPIVRMIYLPGT